MNVILTSICCGKTYLTKSDSRYIDLDIFQGVKTRKQRQIVFDMIKAIAEKNDNITCLFNIDRFDKLKLWEISEIKIVKIILARDYDFRCTVFGKRDIAEYGTVRVNTYKSFRENFSKIIKLGKGYSKKYGVELEFLDNGKFLSDMLEVK